MDGKTLCYISCLLSKFILKQMSQSKSCTLYINSVHTVALLLSIIRSWENICVIFGSKALLTLIKIFDRIFSFLNMFNLKPFAYRKVKLCFWYVFVVAFDADAYRHIVILIFHIRFDTFKFIGKIVVLEILDLVGILLIHLFILF